MAMKKLHRWEVTPAEARKLQLELRVRMVREDRLPAIRTVAGADVAVDFSPVASGKPTPRSLVPKLRYRPGLAIAGVIVYTFPELIEIERVAAALPLTFPYVPGLLSFREIPALLEAFRKLRHPPDLILCDGHGYAHPRRFGLACHLGVLLDLPTIGCAKSRLIGTHLEPGSKAGQWKPLVDLPKTAHGEGERIGAVLRTSTAVKPIYVSCGHRISLERAIEFVQATCDGYRVPRPTREADHFVEAVKRGSRSPHSIGPGR